MWYLIGLLIVFLLIGTIVISIGIGIGFILSKLIPDLEIGMAILSGAIFSIGIIDFFARLLSSLGDKDDNENEDIEFDDQPYIVFPQKLWKVPKTRKKQRKTRETKANRAGTKNRSSH